MKSAADWRLTSRKVSWPLSCSFFLLCSAKGVFSPDPPYCGYFVPSHFHIIIVDTVDAILHFSSSSSIVLGSWIRHNKLLHAVTVYVRITLCTLEKWCISHLPSLSLIPLPIVITSLVDFVTACKSLWRLCGLARDVGFKRPKTILLTPWDGACFYLVMIARWMSLHHFQLSPKLRKELHHFSPSNYWKKEKIFSSCAGCGSRI